MNFSTIFRISENLSLDKQTLVILRWIANIGQSVAVFFVYFFLNFEFPAFFAFLIIFLGIISNIFLHFFIKKNQLKDFNAAVFLFYDLLQLSILLYLTGGISNPFTILLIIPTIVSSTFLSMGTTIILGFFTLIFLFLLTLFHFPLPGIHEYNFTFPKYYLIGIFLSIIIGLIFLSYFGIRFAGETKKRSEAFTKLQQIISKEYELESLGGQAAAAAHSLGTPLATITVVAKELRKEVGEESKLTKDLDLLLSQTKRCGEILKQISQKKIIDDKFTGSITLDSLLNEIKDNFLQTSSKEIELDCSKDQNRIKIKRVPELIFGLRNFIGNAVKFSNEKVSILLISNQENISISIIDDGPGFPNDIIDNLGQPYLKSKDKKTKKNEGTGLGTFLGKTLLERFGAKLNFRNSKTFSGARVEIQFKISDLPKQVPAG